MKEFGPRGGVPGAPLDPPMETIMANRFPASLIIEIIKLIYTFFVT